MKDIIALLWGISVMVVAIYLTATGKFNRSGLGILSAAAILGGLAIANYDIVKRFEGLGVKVETARQEIGTAKDEALAQIKTEVEGHKQSIELLIRSGNDTNEKLGQQKTALTNLIVKAESLDHQIQLDQTNLDVVKQQAVAAQLASQDIFNRLKELSIIMTRITYVQASTKSEFGSSPRLQKAAEILNADLNRVLTLMIADPAERQKFNQELMNSLPH